MEIKDLARLFKGLSDCTRVRIMGLILRYGELCVCDCMYLLDITQSKASRHLRYLANAGLLDWNRKGVWIYYSIPDNLNEEQKRFIHMMKGILNLIEDSELSPRIEDWLQLKKKGDVSCNIQK